MLISVSWLSVDSLGILLLSFIPCCSLSALEWQFSSFRDILFFQPRSDLLHVASECSGRTLHVPAKQQHCGSHTHERDNKVGDGHGWLNGLEGIFSSSCSLRY
eukprot:TRINITY_DN1561_c0_g1_i3.p1 TRINITY_DN1561_c0_g1~~TRINITY_DN1561_c0_g1_i3.p1  ORF type:complete len:103 (+),score=2.19 TRINITY_DN1561_c0_g1_i3:189-497(+)